MNKDLFVELVNSLIEKIEWEENFSHTIESLFEDTTVIATKVSDTASIALAAMIYSIIKDWPAAVTESDYFIYECGLCRNGKTGEVDNFKFSNTEEFYDYLVASYDK